MVSRRTYKTREVLHRETEVPKKISPTFSSLTSTRMYKRVSTVHFNGASLRCYVTIVNPDGHYAHLQHRGSLIIITEAFCIVNGNDFRWLIDSHSTRVFSFSNFPTIATGFFHRVY